MSFTAMKINVQWKYMVRVGDIAEELSVDSRPVLKLPSLIFHIYNVFPGMKPGKFMEIRWPYF